MGDTKKNKALLFDFDGVVTDSEKYYTGFWNEIGKTYLGRENFGLEIKGCTLISIFQNYFPKIVWQELAGKLDEQEGAMQYDYIPGFCEFILSAREKGYKTAIVTSSNQRKMQSVFSKRPELPGMFDHIFTSEDFTESKPSPHCYLKAMSFFGTDAGDSVVFEDSVNGLISGRDSGAVVVGLSTTNPEEVIAGYADLVVPDFTDADKIFKFIGK
ncbi:MAG: HAD family hydrolase [Candidatus Cryptobacteroides sp.]